MKPNSCNNLFSQIIYLETEETTIYYAFIDGNATVGYFLLI